MIRVSEKKEGSAARCFVPSVALTRLLVSSLDSKRLASGESLVPGANLFERSGREAFLRTDKGAEAARDQISERIALLLAALASRAAAQNRTVVQLASNGHFTPEIQRELLTRLPVEEERATEVFGQLSKEFSAYAETKALRGGWGKVVVRAHSLFMMVSPIDVRPAERKRAEVVGGWVMRVGEVAENVELLER